MRLRVKIEIQAFDNAQQEQMLQTCRHKDNDQIHEFLERACILQEDYNLHVHNMTSKQESDYNHDVLCVAPLCQKVLCSAIFLIKYTRSPAPGAPAQAQAPPPDPTQ